MHAASHNQSGSAPNPDVRYRIEFSLDSGKNWQPIVDDRSIELLGSQPKDHWSQSFTYGSLDFAAHDGPVQIRFSNEGRKKYRRVEAISSTKPLLPTRPMFDSFDGERAAPNGGKNLRHKTESARNWLIDAGENVTARWVEMSAE